MTDHTKLDRANTAQRVEWRMEKIEEDERLIADLRRQLVEAQADLAEAREIITESEVVIERLGRQLAEARGIISQIRARATIHPDDDPRGMPPPDDAH